MRRYENDGGGEGAKGAGVRQLATDAEAAVRLRPAAAGDPRAPPISSGTSLAERRQAWPAVSVAATEPLADADRGTPAVSGNSASGFAPGAESRARIDVPGSEESRSRRTGPQLFAERLVQLDASSSADLWGQASSSFVASSFSRAAKEPLHKSNSVPLMASSVMAASLASMASPFLNTGVLSQALGAKLLAEPVTPPAKRCIVRLDDFSYLIGESQPKAHCARSSAASSSPSCVSTRQ